MEKDTEKNSYLLKEESQMGTVKIADDVVANIAALAAAEVDGVASMVGNVPGEIISKIGIKSQSKGVKVDVIGRDIYCSIAITIDYGHNIPGICKQVQDKVKSAVETMTGLTVAEVNIRIAGVRMPKK
ncbi:MAG: Asp23/Gls24 family envelope stress response protein [Lachnospiraceae bacterium]|nr:Asp23/Gls24 family envelope stress response protein [Candidatus Merdinaster equi]